MRFFLIDRITRWEIGVAAEAVKNVTLSEDFFDDHFPRRPVMPGVLILEGLAQLSGLLLEAGLPHTPGRNVMAVMTALEQTKFRAIVRPGDVLHFRAEVISASETGGKVRATATRGESLVAATEIGFDFRLVDDPLLDEKRRKLLELWMQA